MAVGTVDVGARPAALNSYLAVARLDHWFKNTPDSSL